MGILRWRGSKDSLEIKVFSKYNQNVLAIRVEDKNGDKTDDWVDFAEGLKQDETMDLKVWGELIDNFGHKYQRILGRQCRKKPKSDLRRSYFSKVTQETELHKAELFQRYACMELKFRLKSHRNKLNEIIFSESLLRDLGFTTEEFANKVIIEGLPQIMSIENNGNMKFIRELMRKYFVLGTEDINVPETETLLTLKHSYVRPAVYKTYCFMNYETNLFGMDVILAFSALGEPFLQEGNGFNGLINDKFLDTILQRKLETEEFLSMYYPGEQDLEYQHDISEKVCRIKEIPYPDYPEANEIIVKKLEEESDVW